jgi:prepilin signal peptidase PulO-like enzyme (type II secretory pathway)
VSDYFGGDSFSPAAPATVWREQDPAKGAPWLIMGGGLLAVILVLVLNFLFAPAGDYAALGHAGFWLLSLLAFLVPIALFSITDLKRQLVIDYPTHPKTVRTAKTAFLVIGLVASLFQVYQLATELSKLLNVG